MRYSSCLIEERLAYRLPISRPRGHVIHGLPPVGVGGGLLWDYAGAGRSSNFASVMAIKSLQSFQGSLQAVLISRGMLVE